MNTSESKKILVVGGRGFAGSHFVDHMVGQGFSVFILDNGLTGDNHNPRATYFHGDIRDFEHMKSFFHHMDYVFHFAAIARTPWCVKDPILCYETNVLGSLNVLEASKQAGVKKVVLSSSNIVYAAETPYKQSKLAMEAIAHVYTELYGLPTVCLRYSNLYGARQREDGESPNVFAAFRKSFKDKGFIELTGDGEQTRDFTHVSDIVRANIKAAESSFTGNVDICTGRNVTMNFVASELFKKPIEYIPERIGDIKHIKQVKSDGLEKIGWESIVILEDGISDVL